ncbi:MAG: cysteine desulfurase [Proteobacteria bacterium]|nr:cysteine desulfurase [Pseudomonadota bacterium]
MSSGFDPADSERIRKDFPVLQQQVRGKRLAFLDSAASAQRPQVVLDAMNALYTQHYANIHRGVYDFSARTTAAYEAARKTCQAFLGAREPGEIVFVRGTTEGINLVAESYLRPRLEPGDEILITHLEHHSNIVPWQLLLEGTGAVLRVVPINERGELDMAAFAELLSPRTRLVSVAHVSNALGTINPVREIADAAHARSIPVLLDGAQAVPHLPVDVTELDCDFYVFSGHKVFGPTGVGVLYGRRELLESMPPYQGGGGMIESVTFEKTPFAAPPERFEAGTPDIAGAIGLAAALDYVEEIGRERIAAHEHALLEAATDALAEIPRVRLIGTAEERASVLSFVLEGVHAHDVGTILDGEGVAVRAGHHCAQPTMDFFGVPATTRASFALYNDFEDVEQLVAAVRKTLEIFD